MEEPLVSAAQKLVKKSLGFLMWKYLWCQRPRRTVTAGADVRVCQRSGGAEKEAMARPGKDKIERLFPSFDNQAFAHFRQVVIRTKETLYTQIVAITDV
jgi:hypothetical protein